MPPPRTRPFIMPRAVQNAPLEAMRSHRVPIYPGEFGPAAQAMGNDPPERAFLPSKMAQRGNAKDQDGNYYAPNASALSFVALASTPSTALAERLRAPRSPFNPMAELAQTFQDELWAQIHDVDPLQGPSLGRQIPYPGRLPAASFEELEMFEDYARTNRQVESHERRMAAMHEIRASDDRIFEIMGKFRR